MKFLLDSMLGKLARWLRMLGHDVTYTVKLDDSALLELGKKRKPHFINKGFGAVSTSNRKSY